MAIGILSNNLRLCKPFRSKIKLSNGKMEFPMQPYYRLDYISAKTRLSTPLSYRLLKIKIRLFGLIALKGIGQ